MTWERITAADIRVGDKIAQTRKEDPELVVEQHWGERSNVLRLKRLVDATPPYYGKAGQLRRVYPHPHIKFWKAVD